MFENVPFISIGSSEKGYDKFDDGDKESFVIKVKASQNIEPGDYSIPYSLNYVDSGGKLVEKIGSIGIVVGARTEISFDVELDKNVMGEQGQIILKIINSGFGELKFVNVKITSNGFTILGSESDYIGNIDSDDFETATFDVRFNSENAKLDGIVTYKDFNNVEQTESINRSLKIYSKEEAIKLGIIEKDNTIVYIVSIMIVIILWTIYRVVKKRLKKKQRV